jgi:hypothetical protein
LLDVGAQFHIHCNNIDRYLLATTIAPTTNIQSLSNIAPPSGNDNNLVVALAAEGHTAGTPINLTARQPDKEGVDETPAQEVKEAATLPLQEPKILGGEGDAEGGESRVGDGSEEEAHGESQAGEDGDVEMDTNSDAAKGESDDGHGEADGHSLSGEDGESSVDSEHEASGDAHGKKTLSDLDKGARQRSRMSLANRSPTPHHSDQHLSGGEDGDVNMEEQDDVAPQTKPTNVNVQREEDNGEVVQGDDEEEMGLGDDERKDDGEKEGDNEEEEEGEEDDEMNGKKIRDDIRGDEEDDEEEEGEEEREEEKGEQAEIEVDREKKKEGDKKNVRKEKDIEDEKNKVRKEGDTEDEKDDEADDDAPDDLEGEDEMEEDDELEEDDGPKEDDAAFKKRHASALKFAKKVSSILRPSKVSSMTQGITHRLPGAVSTAVCVLILGFMIYRASFLRTSSSTRALQSLSLARCVVPTFLRILAV